MNFLGTFKPQFFLPSRGVPITPNRTFLHCPASRQVYCLRTGSLYQLYLPMIPFSTEMQVLLQQSNTIDHTKSDLCQKTNFSGQVNSTSFICPQNTNAPAQTKKTKKQKKKTQMSLSTFPTQKAPAQNKKPKEEKKKTQMTLSTVPTQKAPVPAQSKKPKVQKKKTQMTLSTAPSQTPSTNSLKGSVLCKGAKSLVAYRENYFVDDKTKFTSSKNNSTTTTTRIYKPYNPYLNPKKKSYIYYISPLRTRTRQGKPLQIDMLLPHRKSFCSSLKEVPKKGEGPTQMTCIRLSGVEDECPWELSEESGVEEECPSKSPDESSLHFSCKYYGTDCLKMQTTKRKKCKHVTKKGKKTNNKSMWRWHEPTPQTVRNSLYENCILASSVHYIINSKFTKNPNTIMPVSMLQLLLNAGQRKCKGWMKAMEQEAIHQYKKLKLKKYRKSVLMEDYGICKHPEKPWLVGFSRYVIDENKKEWPLLVKCLYKYPNSTIKQARKHYPFWLEWSETSYTLRDDHADYTLIQCQMAITNTSYAELLVHTSKETIIVPVLFDEDFWKETENNLDMFYKQSVLPYLKKNDVEPKLLK